MDLETFANDFGKILCNRNRHEFSPSQRHHFLINQGLEDIIAHISAKNGVAYDGIMNRRTYTTVAWNTPYGQKENLQGGTRQCCMTFNFPLYGGVGTSKCQSSGTIS